MANKKFWLGILVMVLALGIIATGCDTGGGGGSNPVVTQPTPLQLAINWANEDARRWACSSCCSNAGINVPFNDPLSNDMIQDPQITFIQFVEDALTEAWYATYRHNPSAWNAAKWKEVINGAFSRWDADTGTWVPYPLNHYFSIAAELPLIIS